MCSNKDKFIYKSLKIHGDRYDYSSVKYVNNKTKVDIICPKHGIFSQRPNNHISNKSGCTKCNKLNTHNKSSKKEFIEKSINIHNNLYDYDLVKYINNKTKVDIICPKHGIFKQKPNCHLSGKGCPKCSKNYKLNTEIFIIKSIKIHGNKYDYSLVNYFNNSTKVSIKCDTHGYFEQTPNSHLMGRGCPKCSNNVKLTNLEFIRLANKKHLNKYDYSDVEYVNSQTKIKIICPEHGIFKQKPNNHLRGEGCPFCKSSKYEEIIANFLNKNRIEHEREKSFDGCKNIYKLRFDFYLPNYNLCIEYNGEQHYTENIFFGGYEYLIKQKKNDEIKSEFCKENGINLLIIPYYKNKSICDILSNILK